MIIGPKSKQAQRVKKIFDANGRDVIGEGDRIYWIDTETGEAENYVMRNGRPIPDFEQGHETGKKMERVQYDTPIEVYYRGEIIPHLMRYRPKPDVNWKVDGDTIDPLDIDDDYVRNADGEVRYVIAFNDGEHKFTWMDMSTGKTARATSQQWLDWSGEELEVVFQGETIQRTKSTVWIIDRQDMLYHPDPNVCWHADGDTISSLDVDDDYVMNIQGEVRYVVEFHGNTFAWIDMKTGKEGNSKSRQWLDWSGETLELVHQ